MTPEFRQKVVECLDMISARMDEVELRRSKDVTDPLDAPVQPPISDNILPVQFEPEVSDQQRRVDAMWSTKSDAPLEVPKENLWEGHPPLPIEHI
jgi:hypothetical protein